MEVKKLIFEAKSPKYLIVSGPAKIRVLEGEIEALSYPLGKGKSIYVKKFDYIPVKLEEGSLLEVLCNANCKVTEFSIDERIKAWTDYISHFIKEPKDTLVLGQSIIEKKNLTISLINSLLVKNYIRSVCFICLDPGGSITPPGFIGTFLINKPTYDLENVSVKELKFHGSLSPFPNEVSLEASIKEMLSSVEGLSDINIVYFHSFIRGERAYKHIKRVINGCNLKSIVVLGDNNLCNKIKTELSLKEDISVAYLPTLTNIFPNYILGRKFRNRLYKFWITRLDGLKPVKISLNLLELKDEIRNQVLWYNFKPVLNVAPELEEFKDEIKWVWIVGKNQYLVKVTREGIYKSFIKGNVRVQIIGKSIGILTGVYYKNNWNLSILEDLNLLDNKISIYIPKRFNSSSIRNVRLGRIIISSKGEELGMIHS